MVISSEATPTGTEANVSAEGVTVNCPAGVPEPVTATTMGFPAVVPGVAEIESVALTKSSAVVGV